MNRRELAYELHRYIQAQRGKEPPTEPDIPEEESGNSPDNSTSKSSNENGEHPEHRPQEKLEALERESTGCTKCKLSEHRTNVVFGQGTIRARVLVIGEGPGAKEDKQGLPFVGPAGELLRGGFQKIGLGEEDLYITNTVKCRPPDNRDPHREELQSCRPYLDRQLELIEPRVILTLGNFALQYCLGENRRIGRSRGEVYNWQSTLLIPTYHPAYILRNPSDSRKFYDDLKRVRVQLRE